jgi:hypothetical protein
MSLTGFRASFAINELSGVIGWARCKQLVEDVVKISI